MVRFLYLLLTSFFLLKASLALCQEKLDIFGYFQVNFSQLKERQILENQTINFLLDQKKNRNSFIMQQMNVFFRKEINEDLTAWVNFELTNSFSTEREWGNFNLEEAWVKYRYNNLLNLKAGLLIPVFNNLNEVKNRTPYLPYIFRPLVYETSISELLSLGDFLPERAYLQAYGSIPASKINLDYAAYLGNSETEFISGESTGTVRAGEDTTTFVSVGGRVGLRSENIKLGFSLTADKDNQNEVGLGNVARHLIGADLSFSLAGFWFEGELILAKHDLDIPNVSLDKKFYYGTLGYDLTEQLFGYLSYNYIEDDLGMAKDGLDAYFVGGGFRPNDAIIIKVQYTKIKLNDGTVPPSQTIPVPLNFNLEVNAFSVALSVLF